MGESSEEPRSEPDARPTIDRRRLIRQAAAAGAVAWTTPVIVGSIASPAAAATAASGLNRIQIGSNCAPMAQSSTCLPTSWATAVNTLIGACITSTTGGLNSCTGFLGAETFIVTGGCSCTFVSARASLTDGTCVAPSTLSAGSVSFPGVFLPVYQQFKFVLSCT